MLEIKSLSSLLHPYGTERGFWKRASEYFERSFGSEPTLDEWETILRDAIDSHVAEFSENGAPLTIFSDLVARRIAWLKRARSLGMTAGKAESELGKRIDQWHERDKARDQDTIERRNREALSRSRTRPIRQSNVEENPW